MLLDINTRIANLLNIDLMKIINTVKLLDEGATVPFIARYRKEVTGGLDDTQLRDLVENLTYMRELDARRITILNSIKEQDKLTPELEDAINNADNKTILEDLYLPYKPKRRTKAQVARESGLEPLALDLLNNNNLDPETEAIKYLDPEKNILDKESALNGAKFIVMEIISENAEILTKIRNKLWNEAYLATQVIEGKEESGAKFADYFAYSELIKTIPSHRILAALRGNNEGALSLSITLTNNQDTSNGKLDKNLINRDFEQIIINTYNVNVHSNAGPWLADCIRLCFKTKIFISLETEIINQLKENADNEAIKVFATNLHSLLLQAPAQNKKIIGLDPGIRTGVKVAVIDDTGKLLTTDTIYPFQPHNKYEQSIKIIANIIDQYQIDLIAIGNGTASRETENLISDLLRQHPDLKTTKVIVSEAGASVYSASALAAKEFPDLDVSLRGAVSIARRLQDPLAELVKIDPKAIGVGQYQHDVNQTKLSETLSHTVEDCVNAVGVDVNTASIPLLTHISGLNATIAKNIVTYRDSNGKFKNREQLKSVPRLGEKAFEQSAGFLRINNGDNVLDKSAVHPESYNLVALIAQKLNTTIDKLIANNEILKNLNPAEFVNDGYGLPTIKDVLHELEKPGRDPRGTFKTAQFKDDINNINDLKTGMTLEGVVTNVTNFGAFIDIGVHQDGLVHISEITNKYISNPSEVLKTGQIVKVEVIDIDIKRNRIGLSMKGISKSSDSTDKATNKQESTKSTNIKESTIQNKSHMNKKHFNGSQGQGMSSMSALALALTKAKL